MFLDTFNTFKTGSNSFSYGEHFGAFGKLSVNLLSASPSVNSGQANYKYEYQTMVCVFASL